MTIPNSSGYSWQPNLTELTDPHPSGAAGDGTAHAFLEGSGVQVSKTKGAFLRVGVGVDDT